jgi:hypothetical protein
MGCIARGLDLAYNFKCPFFGNYSEIAQKFFTKGCICANYMTTS